jgi:hypothetical protein
VSTVTSQPSARPGSSHRRGGRRAAHDWPAVLAEARTILDEHGLMPRPDLWRELLRRGVAAPAGADGFRAAVFAAQRRGEFPTLPRARTGPARGTSWTDDRHAAELERHDEPTPYELYTTREAECISLLSTLAGVFTVKLSPHAFAIFARAGYGEWMVRRAVHALVRAGLAEVYYAASGLDRVPCVKAAA